MSLVGKLRNYMTFLWDYIYEFYARLRTQILSTEPLPSLDRAYHLVVQEERVRTAKAPADDAPPALGFAVRATAGRGRGSTD